MQLLSHTTGYAILALSYVGSREAEWVQAKEIAEQTGLPRPYLSKILHLLGKAKLLRTKRGYRGGVALAKPATALSLLEVASAAAPLDIKPHCVMGFRTCNDQAPCPMHDFWKRVQREFQERLAGITLAQIANRQGRNEFRLPTPAAVERYFRERPRVGSAGRYQSAKPTGRFLRKFQ